MATDPIPISGPIDFNLNDARNMALHSIADVDASTIFQVLAQVAFLLTAQRIAIKKGSSIVNVLDNDDISLNVDLEGTDTGKITTRSVVAQYVISKLLKYQKVIGIIDASANPNYPGPALAGQGYKISVGGKIGGGSGKAVNAGDVVYAYADNAGGAEGAVGTNWYVLRGNADIPAANVSIADPHNVFTATNAEVLFYELYQRFSAAQNVGITDTGGFYSSTNVEDALQEIHGMIAAIPAGNTPDINATVSVPNNAVGNNGDVDFVGGRIYKKLAGIWTYTGVQIIGAPGANARFSGGIYDNSIQVAMTGLTYINVVDATSDTGIVLLSSTNASEDVREIRNFPSLPTYKELEIRPQGNTAFNFYRGTNPNELLVPGDNSDTTTPITLKGPHDFIRVRKEGNQIMIIHYEAFTTNDPENANTVIELADTGWLPLQFPAWYVTPPYAGGVVAPTYRKYGKFIELNGTIMIPPTSGATLGGFNLSSKAQFIANLGVYDIGVPNIAGTSPSSKVYRRLKTPGRVWTVTGGTAVLRTIVELVFDGANIFIRPLNVANSNVATNTMGNNFDGFDPLNAQVSRAASTSHLFDDYVGSFKAAHASGTTTQPLAQRAGVTPLRTFDCAIADDLGGFLIDLSDVFVILD